MKKTLFIIIAMCALLLNACGLVELETSDNGKLDGNWHLVYIDSLNNHQHADYSNKQVFWQIQGKLLQVTNAEDNGLMYIFRFEHSDNHLILSDARRSNRETGDPIVEDATMLAPYGVNAFNEDFFVEKISGKRMTLRSNTLRLYFRKM